MKNLMRSYVINCTLGKLKRHIELVVRTWYKGKNIFLGCVCDICVIVMFIYCGCKDQRREDGYVDVGLRTSKELYWQLSCRFG